MRTVIALLTTIVFCTFALSMTGCAGAATPAAPASGTRSTAPSPIAGTATRRSTETLVALAATPPATDTPLAEPTLPTSTPAPATPVIPSGLYVTYLNTQPDPPVRGEQLEFHVGLANNTSGPQDFRWIVYIYKPDNLTKSYGETTVTRSDEPVGAHEVIGLGYWKLPLGGPCEDFIARVAWLDQNNHAAQFKEPNGQPFEKTLTVCPP